MRLRLNPRWRFGLALLVLASAAARASPWPQGEGNGIAIFQGTGNTAETQGFDATGRPSGRGSYNRFELTAPYWEHGLSPAWTIGLSPRLAAVWQDDGNRRTSSYGVADVGMFARYTLYRGSNDVLAVQGTFFTPGFDNLGHNPRVGEPNLAAEGRVLYGVGASLGGGVNAFAAFEAGYRYRAGSPADEVRLDATFGLKPWDGWLLLFQSFNTIGVRNNGPGGPDYSINKMQASLVYDLTPRWAVQLGYLRDIGGRRVALGQGGVLSLWYRY